MRVVLDTNVIIRAIRSPHSASAMVVVEALRGSVTPLVSTALGLEYEAVSLRPEHWVAPGFGRLEAERFLDALAQVCEPVEISFQWRGLLHDPGDDMVLEVAVNGGADTLVTFNPRHFAGAAERFGFVLSDAQGILRELRKRR